MLEKLAKRLKRFRLDEVEFILEKDCQKEVLNLLKQGKLCLHGDVYEYLSERNQAYKISYFELKGETQINVAQAVEIFLKNHVEHNCKEWTKKTYISIFKTNILPYFKGSMLSELEMKDILEFNEWLKSKQLSDLRTKNTMALLNQLFKYFQNQGVIDKRCEFVVRRIK